MGENCFWSVPPRGFEKVQRAIGIDIKIIEGPGCRQVMTRLGGSMYHQRRTKGFEKFIHILPIPNVQLMMMEIGMCRQKATLIPAGIATGAKEVRAHVVVDAMHFPSELAKIRDNFRADQ